MSADEQSLALGAAVAAVNAGAGPKTVKDFETNSALVLSWIDYFEATVSRNVCDQLLKACRASLVEAAASLALGLVRAALFAIRLELELFLAWAYFNDHPVEWANAMAGESDFPMRKQNLTYLEKYTPGFKKRLTILANHSNRATKEPYALLSKFVHGSSLDTMPDFDKLVSVVQDEASVAACQELQRDVSEYLSDVAISWLANRWHDIPQVIKADVTARLSQNQLKDFSRAA